MSKTAAAALRALFGLGLLAAVVLWLEPGSLLASLTEVRLPPLVAALLLQLGSKALWTLRWRELLRANGIERGFGHLFAVVHIGLFFNTFLPSGVGGDLVRGYYASEGRRRLVSIYLTLFVERVLGMVAFALLAAIGAGLELAAVDSPLQRRLLWTVLVLAGGIVVAGVLVFTWKGWLRLTRPLARRFRSVASAVEELELGLDLFRRPQTPHLLILGSSLLLKLISIVFYLFCGAAVGLELPVSVYFLVVPLTAIVSMLPVTLNGLGVREGVLVALLSTFGAERAAAGALALLVLASFVAFALLGGIIYAFYRRPPAAAVPPS